MRKADTLVLHLPLYKTARESGGNSYKRSSTTHARHKRPARVESTGTGTMVDRERREELRGAEEETFDVLAEVLTLKQWTELLRAPLERAAAKGNRGLALKLVGAGAKIGDALHAATRGGHGGVISDLLDNGASLAAKENMGGMTPLHVAAREGKPEMVQLLMLKGADKEALNNYECTPLYLAVLRGHVSAALALMAAGADVERRFGESKRSIVHLAAQRSDVDMMGAAIEHGADVDAVDTSQSTPLHAAARLNQAEAIDVLMEAGANIRARDRDGCTPLHYAAGRPSLEAFSALMNHGAHVNALDNDHETPLHWAAVKAGTPQTAEVVECLLRSGADETILNDQGKSAAHIVGVDVGDKNSRSEDVDRVRELLANAPADRAWRRRGYLVLCRAHPDRVRRIQDVSSGHASMVRTTRSGAKRGRKKAIDCSGAPVDEQGVGAWAVVVGRVLGLQEEGMFRTILGYL